MSQPNRSARRARPVKKAAAKVSPIKQAPTLGELEQRVEKLETALNQLLTMVRKSYEQQLETALNNPDMRNKMVDQMMTQQLGVTPPGLAAQG